MFYVKKVIQGPVFRIYGLIPNDIALWEFFSETASDTAGVFNYVRCLQTDLQEYLELMVPVKNGVGFF